MSSVAPTSNPSEPVYLDITFGRAVRIWWAVLWRSLLLGGGAGFIVGFIEGFVGASLSTLDWLGQPIVTGTSAFIVGLPIGIYAFRVALKKQYQHFTIRLVPSPR
jgi:hypothetical protein